MLILASKSPRRKELLSLVTTDFVIKSAEVDETIPEALTPQQAVEYLSRIKAEPFANGKDTVIGADTIVVLEGEILGKPQNRSEAFDMLKKLSGKMHDVYTGVTIIKGDDAKVISVNTKVKFFDLTDDEINEYLETGEADDKAGAYGIQGRGGLFVELLVGDYFNVVGLPIGIVKKYL